MMVLGMIVFFVIIGLLVALSLCKFHIDTYKWEVANLTVKVNDLTECGNGLMASGGAWKDAALAARAEIQVLQAKVESLNKRIDYQAKLYQIENDGTVSVCPKRAVTGPEFVVWKEGFKGPATVVIQRTRLGEVITPGACASMAFPDSAQ